MWQLVINGGRHKGRVIRVARSPLLIGRDRGCHLRPQSRSVGGRHCALDVREGKLFVKDLQTRHGTRLNEHRVEGEVEIKPGDRLQVGPLVFVAARQAMAVPILQSRAVDEDTIAEMFLAGEDESPADPTRKPFSGSDTTSDLVALNETLPEAGAAAPTAPKPADEASATAKAAEKLLEKYIRGPTPRRGINT